MTTMKTIIRIATKNKDEPYNILMLLGDDIEYVLKLAETGSNIYIWSTVNGKTWPEDLQKPENCYTVTYASYSTRTSNSYSGIYKSKPSGMDDPAIL